MIDLLKVVAGIFLLALAFLPAILIAISSIKLKRLLGGFSSYAILIACILLTLQPFEFLLPIVLTLSPNIGPEEYAKSTIIMSYVKIAFNYVALLLLGVGLLRQSYRLKSLLAKNG